MRLVQNAIVQESSRSVTVCLSYDPVREQTQPETLLRDLVAMLFSDTGRLQNTGLYSIFSGVSINGATFYCRVFPLEVV